MSLVMKWILAAAIAIGHASAGEPRPSHAVHRRAVTVADSIAMTRVAGSRFPYLSPKNDFAVFSPDGTYFAIVLAKGDLTLNANIYSLLLFRSSDVHLTPRPKILGTFSTSSNRAGIALLRWLDDNDTLLFLGTRGAESTQLYSVHCRSGKLKELTNHESSVVSYAASVRGDKIVFAAEGGEKNVLDQEVLRDGLEVNTQRLSDLLRGRVASGNLKVFLKKGDLGPDIPLTTNYPIDIGVESLSLSPDGRYLVLKTDTTDVPEDWRQYHDYSIQILARRKFRVGFRTGVLRYELIDTQNLQSELLLDSPTTYSSEVLWSPDSHSLLLCGTFLPFNLTGPGEKKEMLENTVVAEISLPDRHVKRITSEELRPVRWDRDANIAEFIPTKGSAAPGDPSEEVYFRKVNGLWERLSTLPFPNPVHLQIVSDEGMNTFPTVYAIDLQTKQRTVLLNLNPQFADLAFGSEQVVHWKTKNGDTLEGGLYLPPDYIPGKRYPLVIQTHGFDPLRFWIDGPYSTAFAAQPLAGRGILVLQMNDNFHDTTDTPQEAERVMHAYEGAIDYLDQNGMVDRGRVGLIGFSRTCFYVKYTLTHSDHHFAAALVSDGIDAGYLQYLMYYNADPGLAREFESVIGSAPFGDGISLWLKDSPGFLLDKVQTPLLIQAIGEDSILGEWQWFEGLTRLGKPVDLVYLPRGTHILAKPWERMVSQEESVDWFCFWFGAKENSTPWQTEQYSRWRGLRARLSLP